MIALAELARVTPERSRLHAFFSSIETAAEIGAALPPEPMRRLLAGIVLAAREGMEDSFVAEAVQFKHDTDGRRASTPRGGGAVEIAG